LRPSGSAPIGDSYACLRDVLDRLTIQPAESKSCCRTVGDRQAPQPEQPRCICTGGHLTDPYEQNTQQSPAFGRNSVLQRSHS
jgi:hypothetical protein